MFEIKNRADYRERLEYVLKLIRGQRKATARRRDNRHQEGMEYGIGLALETLDEWDRQSPEK